MQKIILSLFFLGLCFSSVEAGVKTKEVTYRSGGITMKGYLAYDDSLKGQRPGVLVVHEWWGHNAYARKRAEMLAQLGYSALAVDMYGDGKSAQHPEDAGKFSGEVLKNLDVMAGRFQAAYDFLKKQKTVDPARIGAIGYCFGGAVVLQMARDGVDLKGVVSFHGSLTTQRPAPKGQVKAKVLVCHGAADEFISAEQIDTFKNEMMAAGADYTFVSYEGAKHSFTNPDADTYGEKFGLAVAYSASADQQSWQDMKEFFQKVFDVSGVSNL